MKDGFIPATQFLNMQVAQQFMQAQFPDCVFTGIKAGPKPMQVAVCMAKGITPAWYEVTVIGEEVISCWLLKSDPKW